MQWDPEQSSHDVVKTRLLSALRPAADLAANPWGFRGMHGNLAELCDDDYAPYPVVGDERPTVCSWPRRVVRGGSVMCEPLERRSAYRGVYGGHPAVGVRLACDVDAPLFDEDDETDR
jgi:formylglycine-generating enzyme required for sulfatase activity